MRNLFLKFRLCLCLLLILTVCGCNQNQQQVSSSDSISNNPSTSSVVSDTILESSTPTQTELRTPINIIAADGVPIKSTKGFTEEEKVEILKAYEALKVYYDKYISPIYHPNASQYITSIDDVRYSTDILNRYTPDVPMPDVEFSFWVTCKDYPMLSSSRKNEWYYACKINGEWTTYTEYKAKHSQMHSD